MAKLAGVACTVVLMCMAFVMPHAEAITCNQVVQAVSPCLGYLTSGGAVPAGCCNGIKGLLAAAKTTVDRRTACTCLKSAAGSIKSIQLGLVAGLPGKCGVSIPYQIGPNTDCSKYHLGVFDGLGVENSNPGIRKIYVAMRLMICHLKGTTPFVLLFNLYQQSHPPQRRCFLVLLTKKFPFQVFNRELQMKGFKNQEKIRVRSSGWEGIEGHFKDEDGKGSEGRRWVWGWEESDSKRGFSGNALIGKAFEGGELVDKFMDVGDIENRD
ncbi:hypothetical protein ACH5RR_007204 [Cinchona calisaya]|uniref:Non-specific lipid-transfer protein n=1 Tax=Cinchona calisaya TaxID=153742 RepID=A0ABD3AR76_9GENT